MFKIIIISITVSLLISCTVKPINHQLGSCNSAIVLDGSCKLSIENQEFIITNDGHIQSSRLNLNLILPEGFSLEIVRDHIKINNIIYFNIEISDECSGSALIIALDISHNKIIWQSEIPAFNSSPMLIKNNSLYVAGIG